MGTSSASLLDLIARGGPLPSINQAQEQEANTALTRAQTQNVPIQGQLTQAQVEQANAAAQRQQLENQQIQQTLNDQDLYRKAIQAAYPGLQQRPDSSGAAPADATATAPANGSPSSMVGPPQSNITTPPFVNNGQNVPVPAVPDQFKDPVGFHNYLLSRGVSPMYANQVLTNNLTTQKALLGLPKEQLEAHEAELVPVQRILEGVDQILDGPAKELAYLRARSQVQQLDPDVASSLPPRYDPGALKSAISLAGGLAQYLAHLKTQQETATSAAEAGKSKAETQESQERTKKLAFENSLLGTLKDPANLAKMAEQIAPAAQYPDVNRQLNADLGNAQSLEEMRAAREKASSTVLARTPEAMQAKAKEAQQVAKAVAPIEEQKAEILAEANHARQLGDTVGAKYYESLADQRQSLSTANTIQKVLDLSKQGNAVAGAQLKALVPEFTNAIQDIKRMASSQGDKGLASAQDHLASEIASIAEGKPLSDKVQAEITPYVQTIANGATARHNAQVEALKTAYPNQAKNLKPEVTPFLSATGPGGHQIRSSDGGKTWVDAKTGVAIQ